MSIDITIPPPDEAAMEAARARQDRLTKPAGSLGRLEELSIRLAGITGRLDPPLQHRVVFTLAADHGVAHEGVSAYPPEVTPQMVLNFLHGGAAINVLAKVARARVVIADLGVDADLPSHPDLHALKVRRGTASITRGPAMSPAEARLAIDHGRQLVAGEVARGLDIVMTGDMGIGNTTAAAALAAALYGGGGARWAGRGTGVDDAGFARKQAVIDRGLARHATCLGDPLAAAAALGGRELAAILGAALAARRRHVPVLLDGFVSTAAVAPLAKLRADALAHALAAHVSAEAGHRVLLDELALAPLLDLDMRLGEASGAAVAIPVLRAALACHVGMATFGEAKVSDKLP
jgi:nicotinate-nucleotide--dimethylbenzimidazole phosphoribosyltransferase